MIQSTEGGTHKGKDDEDLEPSLPYCTANLFEALAKVQ